jgi:hypothetical protein
MGNNNAIDLGEKPGFYEFFDRVTGNIKRNPVSPDFRLGR